MDMQQWKEIPRDWIYTGNPEGVNAEIRAHMARRDLHHNEVANILGLKRQALARRLHGETPWRHSELDALAIAWGLLPSDLIGITGAENPASRTNGDNQKEVAS